MIVGGSGRGERGRLLLFALTPLLEERGESALKIGRINAASIGCCSRRAWPTTNLRAAVAGLPSGSVRRAPTPRYGTRPPDEAHVVTFVVTLGFPFSIRKPEGYGVQAFLQWAVLGSNQRPWDQKSRPLPTELTARDTSGMPKGYAEGPAADEAEARLDAIERGEDPDATLDPGRQAVYGSTPDDAEKHFIGWLGEVDPDALFDAGQAWGLSVVRRRA